jgi:outer membrane lipoprotein-sorting protein
MRSKMIKFAAVVVIMIALLIGLNQFGGWVGGDSVAFGEVLEYLQTSSYTFDLTLTEKQPVEDFTMQAMVWESGRMRVDCSAGGAGKISSITDFNAGKSILLFHQNRTGVMKKESVLNKNTGAGGMVSFSTKPIENLWNVRDGTEEQLGEKEINGRHVTGFRVFQEDQYFEYDITIWADSESGVPNLVETIAKPLNESHLSIRWTMENFNLDVELDEELFSLDLPEGYTLGYQEDLEKFEVETEPSDESKKIVQMLEGWSEGRKDEAIEFLLGVDWTKQIEFGKEPYIFSITEKGYISLKAEDQKHAMEEIMTTAVTVREIVHEAVRLGQEAVSSNNYETAEQYYEAGLQLGKLLARDPESMIMVRLLGIAVEKKTLNEMISMHKTTNNQEKLQVVEKQLRAAEAEGDKIKKEAMGR